MIHAGRYGALAEDYDDEHAPRFLMMMTPEGIEDAGPGAVADAGGQSSAGLIATGIGVGTVAGTGAGGGSPDARPRLCAAALISGTNRTAFFEATDVKTRNDTKLREKGKEY